jgi:hypothetical protein
MDATKTLMLMGLSYGNIYQAMKAVSDAIRHLDPSLNEALLIHICYSPRRYSTF